MLLVDTYNVLHQTGILPPEIAGLDVPGLAALIGESRYGRGRHVRLVCDGLGPGAAAGLPDRRGWWWLRVEGVEVVYAGPGREADEVIEAMIERHRAFRGPVRLAVVSSDRRIRKAARRGGARSVASDTLLRHLASDVGAGKARPRTWSPEVPLDRHSVASWMREFGFDPGGLTEPGREQEGLREAGDGPREPGVRPEPRPAEERTPPRRVVEPPDPLLEEVFREWRERLSADDLNMSRWVDGVTPLRPKRGKGRA